MKKHGFIILVACMLVCSSLILTGCMVAAGDYDMSSRQYNMEVDLLKITHSPVIEDAPTSQSKLDIKFGNMFQADEESNTVTVITSSAHSEYWEESLSKGQMPSLSVEEVMYIIQDSIKLYNTYDNIDLAPLWVPASIDKENTEPIAAKQISHKASADAVFDLQDTQNVFDIIMYRLHALSTPEAFISAEYAIRYAGGNPDIYSGLYPELDFFIPDYGNITDIDSFIKLLGGDIEMILKYPTIPYTYIWFGGYKINLRDQGANSSLFPSSN